MVAACDDSDGRQETIPLTMPSSTGHPITATSKESLSPTLDNPEPVKIGAITSWSGPSGMAGLLADDVMSLVEDQVHEQGGILGGRPVKFTKYDDEGQVARVISGWQRLVLEEEVSAIVFGGGSAATITASSDAAEEFRVPFFNFSPLPRDLTDRPYTVRCSYSKPALTSLVHDFLLEELEPDTVAILCENEETMRSLMEPFKRQMDKDGVQIVYEEYVPFETKDLMPYLTKLKYADPDVLIVYFSLMDHYTILFKNILELDGWGDITVISPSAASSNWSITSMTGAEGSYHLVLWAPGVADPAAQEFEQDFTQEYGRLPISQHVFFYLSAWGAIHAIELAGSDDPEDIATAARSGGLRWDSPAGMLTVLPSGETDLSGHLAQVVEGQLVPVVTDLEVGQHDG